MRIFCPYCSAEHAVDVNQIPLVGMDFHCPQCTRSFRVTADGEVEATEETDVDGPIPLGGADSEADPFAAFAEELDLTAEMEVSSVTDEELMAASMGGGKAAPPPLPSLFGDDEGGEDEGERTAVMPAAEAPSGTSQPPPAAPSGPPQPARPSGPPPRPAGPPQPAAAPEAPGPQPTTSMEAVDPFAGDDGLSEQDLVLIGSYYKTSDSLHQAADVVWTDAEAAAAAREAREPRPQRRSEPRPDPGAPPSGGDEDPFADAPVDQSVDLGRAFELTGHGESPAAAPDAPPAGGGEAADWAMGDIDTSDPFASPTGGGDALFDFGPAGGGAPAGGAGQPAAGGDPDALFDLDLEIGSPSGPPSGPPPGSPTGPPSDPPGGGAGDAMGPATDIGSLGTSQPLLEEMDFSSLLQEEEGGGGEDSIFDLEPSGVFEGAAVADAPSEAAAAGRAAAGGAAADDFGDQLFDLDLGGDAMPGGGPGGPPSAGGAGLEQSFASDSAFKPAKVPTQKKRRGMSKGLQWAVFGVLVVAAVGIALGQVPDVGYFGVNLLFPPEKAPPPPKPRPQVKTDPAALTADTVTAYLDQIQRLEKALELHPDDEGAKKALAEVLAKFSTRYPGEFEHNKKFQRRLAELTRELGLGESSTIAVRQKLLSGDPKEAKAALDRLLMEKAGGAEVALLRGQIEMKEGDYAEAIPHFETALQLDPESIEARYLLGRSLRLVGRLPDALAAYQAVLKKSPEHDSARIGMAELRLEMSQPKEALELAHGILEDAMARKLTEQTFAAHRLLARIYAQLNQPEKEKQHLEEALSIKPYDEPLLLQMASYLKARGDLEAATQRLAACWDNGCDATDYYHALAELYLETGDSERALEVIQTGLDKYEADISLLLLQGRVLRRRGEVVAARESYRQAIEADASNVRAHEAFADLLLEMDRTDEAVAALKEGIEKVARPESLLERLASVYERRGKRTDAQQILGQLVDRDPLNFKARLELAVLLKRQGLVAEALSHFEFLYRNNQMQRDIRLEYADALRVARRYDQAERELRQILRIDPNDLVAQVLMGSVLVEQSHFDEAEGYLKAVIEKEPRHGMAFYYLGKLELARDNPSKALDYFAQAVRAPDAKPDYNFAYAETLMAVGGRKNLKKAEDSYSGIITAEETGTGRGFERMTDVYLHRGQARLELHRYDKALEDFEKAMELNPLRADTVTAFASGLIKKRRYADAQRYLETVIKENPNFAPAHYQLGIVFNARRKLKQAKRHFLKSVMEDDTAFPDAHRYLGFIFREQRLDREAKRYLKRYLELAPEDAPDRADIERLIGRR